MCITPSRIDTSGGRRTAAAAQRHLGDGASTQVADLACGSFISPAFCCGASSAGPLVSKARRGRLPRLSTDGDRRLGSAKDPCRRRVGLWDEAHPSRESLSRLRATPEPQCFLGHDRHLDAQRVVFEGSDG
jgi:hypothetical protein